MKFNAFYAVTLNAYCPFSIEAETAEEAQAKAEAMLEHGSFHDVLVKVDWDSSDNDRVRGFYPVDADGDRADTPVEQLEGFIPLTECSCEEMPTFCKPCLAKMAQGD